jgi:hypothetical protein
MSGNAFESLLPQNLRSTWVSACIAARLRRKQSAISIQPRPGVAHSLLPGTPACSADTSVGVLTGSDTASAVRRDRKSSPRVKILILSNAGLPEREQAVIRMGGRQGVAMSQSRIQL